MGFEFSEEDVRQQIQGDGTNGTGVLRSAAKAFVTFRMWAALDGPKTAERGYPAFRDTVYFSRRGEKNDGVDKEATEEHIKEYANEYRAFREWMKDPQYPVFLLSLPPYVMRLLDAGEITTVQELAGAPNLIFRDEKGNIDKRVSIDAVPELIEPRALAREWLSKRPQPQKEALPETETEKLQRQIAELQAQVAAKPKRGGRKPGSKNKPKVPRVEDAKSDS